MRKLLVLFSLVAILSGCATTEGYNNILESWVGSDINELVDSWGYPDSSFEAPNGNKVYVYGYEQSISMPSTDYTSTNYSVVGDTIYGTSTTNTVGGYRTTHSCTTFFEVDSKGKIVTWQWKGNACRA